MIAKEATTVPVAMETVRRRLERWRSTRASRRSPIPSALWAAAVRLARRHGLYPTARTLRLDYTTLKKQLHAADDRALVSPTFVELAPLPSPTSACDCVIEIEAPGGGRMRVQVKGIPDLVALSRVVWSGEA